MASDLFINVCVEQQIHKEKVIVLYKLLNLYP